MASGWATTCSTRVGRGIRPACCTAVIGILQPVNLTEPQPGGFIFDLGRNFAGWANLSELRHGQFLYQGGARPGR
jgi:hypothetical protein